MDLPRNAFKAGLTTKACQVGLWSSLCNNISAEIIGNAGFDWIVLDAEHAPNENLALVGQLQALACGTASPIIRVAENDPVRVKQVLDVGVLTVLFPQIHTAEQARAAVASTRFPPNGVRGVATTARASRFGAVPDYLKVADSEICVIVMVESERALQGLPDITAVEGVDAVLIGPQDLAADLGYVGEPNHPRVRAALEEAARSIQSSGKAAGLMVSNEEEAVGWMARGARFVGCANDAGLLARSSESLAARLRAAVPESQEPKPYIAV